MKTYLAVVVVVLFGLAVLEISLFSKYSSKPLPVQPKIAQSPQQSEPTSSATTPRTPSSANPISTIADKQDDRTAPLAKTADSLIKATINTARKLDGVGLQLTRLTSKQESQLGLEIHRKVMDAEKEWNNPSMLQRLQRLARPLLDQRHRKDIAYQISILNSEQINAFSHAGGYVYLHRGLIEKFPSDASLVMVLGHEIGHIDLRHCVESIQYEIKLQQWAGSMADLASFAYRTLRTPYKREQEFDADTFGFQAGRKAGWARKDLMQLYRDMQIMEAASGSSQTVGGLAAIKEFCRSHPHTEDRIRRLDALAETP